MRNVRVRMKKPGRSTPLLVIARGSRSEAKVVVVELEENGVKGGANARLIHAMAKASRRSWPRLWLSASRLRRTTLEQIQRLLPAGAARNA